MQKETGELILSEIIKINSEIGKINGELKGISKRLDGVDGRLDGIDARLDNMDRRIDKLDVKIDQKFDGLREEMKSNFSDMADHITFVASEIWNKTERRKVYA